MEDLSSALMPEQVTVVLKTGESITVEQLTTGQTLSAIESIFSLIDTIQAAGGSISLQRLLVSNSAAVFNVVGIAIGKPADFFPPLKASDTVALIKAVVAVNMPFFVEEVLPLLRQVALAMGLVQPAATPEQEPAENG